jgi:hypothetical protein
VWIDSDRVTEPTNAGHGVVGVLGCASTWPSHSAGSAGADVQALKFYTAGNKLIDSHVPYAMQLRQQGTEAPVAEPRRYQTNASLGQPPTRAADRPVREYTTNVSRRRAA